MANNSPGGVTESTLPPGKGGGSQGLDILDDPAGGGALDVLKKSGNETRRPSRKKTGSRFELDYGTAKVKAYPVTRSELFELGGVSAIASIAFSVAWNCFSFILDTERDIDLAGGAAPGNPIEHWRGLSQDAEVYGFVALAVGILVLFAMGFKIYDILSRTHFESH